MKYIPVICILLFSVHLNGQVNFTSSNLPIVLINTNGQAIPDEPKMAATMKIIFNSNSTRNSVDDTQYNYNGHIGIERRGNSSQSFDQKQYTIETRDSAGENLNVALLDMPAENDWMLHAPYNDISLIRNVLAYHLWSEMGHWAPRTRLVELVLNGEYQGIYVLTETIKRDANRINIASLQHSDTAGMDITGGYIMKIDASNSDDDLSFQSKVQGIGTSFNNSVTWLYHYPGPLEIHPKQIDYIHNYIDSVELLLQSDKFDDPVNGYVKYLSIPSFIDYFIHTELSLNSDGFKRSAYFYKEKSAADGTRGKLKVGSVWDYNLAYGNCNFCNGNEVNAWVYKGCETSPVPAMWMRLLEDPDFSNAVKCRYVELRKGILSDSNLHAFIDDYALMLDEAQERHFEQWDGLLDNGSPGGFWGSDLWFSAYRVSTYAEEIDTLKGWLSARLSFLDNNLEGTCLKSEVNANTDFDHLLVFPNPASDRVVIESSKPMQIIEIYNMEGNLMTRKITNHVYSIEVLEFKTLPYGLYMLSIQTNDGARNTKVIIKK